MRHLGITCASVSLVALAIVVTLFGANYLRTGGLAVVLAVGVVSVAAGAMTVWFAGKGIHYNSPAPVHRSLAYSASVLAVCGAGALGVAAALVIMMRFFGLTT